MNLPLLNSVPAPSPLFLSIVFIWSIAWKGIALWRAAHANQKTWFVAILLLNTIGTLEIVYLFKFAKKKLTIDEMKSWIPKNR